MRRRRHVPPIVLAALVFLAQRAIAADVDTQFIFGFTQGADVGELGEKEIESETVGRFGKADGSYAALTSQLRAEFTPLENFRFEAGAFADYHSIAGVSGFVDRDAVQFGGFAIEARYRLLNRRTAPFGLTIGIEPHWAQVDDQSGERVDNWGGELVVAIDQELIKDRLFAALNVLYDPEWTHVIAGDTWQPQSTLGLSAAATAQIDDGVFVGIEAHYERAYGGTGLNALSGDALFLGPTTYLLVTRNLAVSVAWSIQVAGGAVAIPGSLDLNDFERSQLRLRFEYTF